ncbi:MAG: hypothetical protein R2991_00295 [Thermoanaerobaculia bacterium]
MKAGDRFSVTSPLTPREALAEAARALEEWGGLWHPGIDGGRLELPVTAGLRRGVVTARLAAASERGGSRLDLEVESSRWEIHRSAVMVLLLGAAGALSVTLWPFFPALLSVAPVGGILAFVAWLLIVSRLRTSGPEEFLAGLAAAETVE